MKQFEDYFKSRAEVEQYFGEEVFKFTFMSDNLINFETLNPAFIDGELVNFRFSFFYKSGYDFFAYSSFKTWFDKFQIHEVECISEETHERAIMYSEVVK